VPILPGRWRWLAVLPVTRRWPACRTRIGPYPLAAGVALAAVGGATSAWELAAVAWLIMIAVPLAFTNLAVHRLPDLLTATTFTGTLALLTATALAGHQPGHLARAAIGAAALLVVCVGSFSGVIRRLPVRQADGRVRGAGFGLSARVVRSGPVGL
jgi:leader peptidase (prepilin peptidase)/N-methyltransferase